MNCNPFIKTFNSASQTTLNITPAMRERFCDIPTITVFHRRDPPETGYRQIDGISIALDGMPLTKITVDHGGPASGFLKIQ